MPTSHALLTQVLSLPTAPMHETAVATFIRDFAKQHGLNVRADAFGNLLVRSGRISTSGARISASGAPGVGVSDSDPGAASSVNGRGRPRYVVTAHMDHPGGEVVRCRGSLATVRILGGLDAKQVARAQWRFFPNDGAPPPKGVGRLSGGVSAKGVGRLVKRPPDGTGRAVYEFAVRVARPLPPGTFGMLDIPPVRFVNGLVKARAIDNIANCAVILDVLAEAQRRRIPLLGVFTRAEEIGCVGAQALLRSKLLPRNLPIIVLEASSAKVAKVTIGGGPVIRVGDRLTAFDPRVDLWLHHTAAQLQKKKSPLPLGERARVRGQVPFQFQRALMAGGATEGAYYIIDGYMVGALALPLGNYHNRGRRGPAPEIIAWRDWLGLRELLGALLSAPSPKKVAQQVRARMWRT